MAYSLTIVSPVFSTAWTTISLARTGGPHLTLPCPGTSNPFDWEEEVGVAGPETPKPNPRPRVRAGLEKTAWVRT